MRFALLGAMLLTVSTSTAAEFYSLNGLDGSSPRLSRAESVSADGRVVVGRAYKANGQLEAFRWTRETGMVGLGQSLGSGDSSVALDVWQDGSLILGYFDRPGGYREGFLLRNNKTEPLLFGPRTTPTSISADASTVCGYSHTTFGGLSGSFCWTEDSGLTPIELPSGQRTFVVEGVSANGIASVGYGNASRYVNTRAFRWSESTGMVSLDTLPRSPSDFDMAHAITPDGTVIVGKSDSPIGIQATRWTNLSQIEGLGILPGHFDWSSAYAVSNDGSVVVGESGTNDNASDVRAFVWTERDGMRDLKQVLIDDFGLGDRLDGWTLTIANDISADGKTIVGHGYNPDGVLEGWMISLAPNLVGDYNHDGMLTTQDLDLQTDAMQGLAHPQTFDLNGDAFVDYLDRALWVRELKQTWIGDANLDGEFNSTDFVDVFTAGKYESGRNAGWSEGDWNGDGLFGSGDFVVAFVDGGYELGPQVQAVAVPEPASATLLLAVFGIALPRMWSAAARRRFRSSET